MKSNYKWYVLATLLVVFLSSTDTLNVEQTPPLKSPVVYRFEIRQDIVPSAWRLTKRAFDEAESLGASYIIIHMNTYGGMVNIADSIRTKILNSKIPVIVFIDNNAASAGALISIACDSIYMRKGANIGAATVVNQTGEVMPDKYQSYMRSTMRSTAESHGADTIITNNDTVIKWHRDPNIAEAMVDENIEIAGIIEKGKVLTFTANEAIKYGFCEGIAENIQDVLTKIEMEDAQLISYQQTGIDKLIFGLMNPVLQGILIMIIIGGIYFELQTPGIGFPIGASILAAILYFAPLYLEGLAENWELLIFILGIALLAVEIFVIPGFGVAGIAGIVLMVTGLTMALVDNLIFEFDKELALNLLMRSLLLVVSSLIASLVLVLILSRQMVKFPNLKMALGTTQQKEDGFVAVDIKQKSLIGKTGVAHTVLRPTGKIRVETEVYDAIAEVGFIDRGAAIKIIRDEASQLIVRKI